MKNLSVWNSDMFDDMFNEAVSYLWKNFWHRRGWWIFTVALLTLVIIASLTKAMGILILIATILAILPGVNRWKKLRSDSSKHEQINEAFRTLYFSLTEREQLLLKEMFRCFDAQDIQRALKLMTSLEVIAHRKLNTKSLIIQAGIRRALGEFNICLSECSNRLYRSSQHGAEIMTRMSMILDGIRV